MAHQSEPVLGRRRGDRWVKVGYGLYRPATESSSRHEDLLAWRLVLPGTAAFTHLTAAAALGWWLPPLPADLPVFASMADTASRPQRPGLVVSRHRSPPAVTIRNGIPLAEPAEVLLASARDLALLDLVVLIDSALHSGACTTQDLERIAADRRRGAPLLRRALALADERSESPWETLLRILHVVCEVPVQPQYEVIHDGLFVARGDLWIEGSRALQEYDGGEHLERPRQRRDLQRARRLVDAGWIRRGYTSRDVLQQGVTILRDADASLGRSHRPDRIRAWNLLLRDSLFTPVGQERLLERLRRRGGIPSSATGEGRTDHRL